MQYNKTDSLTANLLKGIQHRLRTIFNDDYKKASLNWYQVKRLKHLPYNTPNTFTLKGTTIHFNNGPELLHSLVEIFVEDIYHTAFKTSSPYIIDCGANIGLSVLYFKQQHPGAQIVAFEPDKTNYSYLQKNIAASGFTDVQLQNEAVWKEDAVLEFINDGTLSSKIDTGSTGKQVTKVKAVRLKNLLNKKVDFLKIDIEGAEYEVLKDCGESLQAVDHLFIEFHGSFSKMNELTEILTIVEKNHFAFYIKEASNVYPTPFSRAVAERPYDIQLNIFCFKA